MKHRIPSEPILTPSHTYPLHRHPTVPPAHPPFPPNQCSHTPPTLTPGPSGLDILPSSESHSPRPRTGRCPSSAALEPRRASLLPPSPRRRLPRWEERSCELGDKSKQNGQREREEWECQMFRNLWTFWHSGALLKVSSVYIRSYMHACYAWSIQYSL